MGNRSSMILGNSPKVPELVKDRRVVNSGVVDSGSALYLSTPPCGQFVGVSIGYNCTHTSGIASSGPRDEMGLQDRGGRRRMLREIRSIE